VLEDHAAENEDEEDDKQNLHKEQEGERSIDDRVN
jgi:hypothetical protein